MCFFGGFFSLSFPIAMEQFSSWMYKKHLCCAAVNGMICQCTFMYGVSASGKVYNCTSLTVPDVVKIKCLLCEELLESGSMIGVLNTV